MTLRNRTATSGESKGPQRNRTTGEYRETTPGREGAGVVVDSRNQGFKRFKRFKGFKGFTRFKGFTGFTRFTGFKGFTRFTRFTGSPGSRGSCGVGRRMERVALITGAGSGIGRGVAVAL